MLNFKDLRRCKKCILPETFPGIKFDDEGLCNYCRSYEPVKVLGEEALDRRLDSYRNNGNKYDCIVPISGGRDSTFVLYKIVKRYNMSVLALTYDSGFSTSEGLRNAKRITEILGVDHVILRNEEKIKAAKKNAIKRFHGWLKMPSINTIVPTLNSGDKTMNLIIYNYAKKNGIPLVIGGNNIGNSSFEQEHWKTGFMGVFPDDRGLYSHMDKLKLVLLFGYEFFKNPYNYHADVFREYLEGIGVYFFESYLKPKDIESLGFYDYIYWDEKEILSTIRKETDWIAASDTSTTWRIDDTAYPLINYIYQRLVGFTEHDEMYSKMIREGQITQEEGLRRCMSDQAPRILSLNALFNDLQVNKKEVDYVLDKYGEKLLRKGIITHKSAQLDT
jgi:glutamine---fructose-6-phosphate transaminase (isomerizing)